MEIKFVSIQREEIAPYFALYVQSLSAPIDSFLEDHILRSDFFAIVVERHVVGYTAVYHKSFLTQFFIVDEYKALGQAVYAQIKELAEVKNIFVPTCDEFFLSHALESHTGLAMQAYFFQDSKQSGSHQVDLDTFALTPATPADIPFIQEKSGDFFSTLAASVQAQEIFIGAEQGACVSFGVIETSQIDPRYASIGMYVLAEKRRSGFGTKTVLKLKERTYEMGRTPIAGCWYGNHHSKKTLEKAGMYSQTRLLNIHL